MRQATTQVLGSSAVFLSAAEAITTSHRSEKQHWQYVLLGEISRSRAISVETTAILTLEQAGKHVRPTSGSQHKKSGAIIAELPIAAEFGDLDFIYLNSHLQSDFHFYPDVQKCHPSLHPPFIGCKIMHFDSDVIIVGAGVAGLSAATVLARAGLRVVILEGRDRVGGRIFTRRDPDCNAVIELGAEFVHGCPAEIWDLLKRHDIGARELTGESWCVRDEKLSTCDFFSQVDELLEKMDDRTPDQSFLQFVDKCCTDVKMQQTKAMALRYVTGFHAALTVCAGVAAIGIVTSLVRTE